MTAGVMIRLNNKMRTDRLYVLKMVIRDKITLHQVPKARLH